jgi:hypothetical protein
MTKKIKKSLEKIAKKFDAFVEDVRRKLYRGAEEYGDASFEMTPIKVVGELKAESHDLAGWGWILDETLDSLDGRVPPHIIEYLKAEARELAFHGFIVCEKLDKIGKILEEYPG